MAVTFTATGIVQVFVMEGRPVTSARPATANKPGLRRSPVARGKESCILSLETPVHCPVLSHALFSPNRGAVVQTC